MRGFSRASLDLPQQVPVASRLSVATDSTGAVVNRPPIITSLKWWVTIVRFSQPFLFAKNIYLNFFFEVFCTRKCLELFSTTMFQ